MVYVDGFNLYNRALRQTRYKWLDLEAMSQRLLRRYDIHRVRYFTARIKARQDAQAPARQAAYLRAIAANPKVTVHLGQFLITRTWMPAHPLEYDSSGDVVKVQVRKTEEKGSDVNIASHMMFDAFRDDADAFVLLSNDSDLAETMRLLSIGMRRTTGIIFPTKNPSNELLSTEPAIIRQVREGTLRFSQMPETVADLNGAVHRPAAW